MGLYQKYKIEKTDGTPTDPNAQYFVLRLDTDLKARYALWVYAKLCKEHYEYGLSKELYDWLDAVEERWPAWE